MSNLISSTYLDARTFLIFTWFLAMVASFAAPPPIRGDDIECGFDESAFGGGVDFDCADPQMTMAMVWTTHQRIMQAPNSPWPDSTYLTGMVQMEAEFEDFVKFVSTGRTNLDVRVIRRRGADSVFAWVMADSTIGGIQNEILSKINAGKATPQDSTFFKNADGIFLLLRSHL
jgi:hypothetical protein